MIPKYCRDCRTMLVWGDKTNLGYDEEYGKRKFVWTLMCPVKKWWQICHYEPIKARRTRLRTRFHKFTYEEN